MTRPNPSPNRPHPRGSGGREDCWSEGATKTLIEAWGDRYVQLNRGNLRQKDWKEVADAVNDCENGAKSRKTDVQCKNRIDTLKKKYKVEKSKPPPSKWGFYNRLDSLIGANAVTDKKPTTFTLTVKSSKTRPSSSTIRGSAPALYSRGSVESSLGGDDDDEEEDDLGFDGRSVRKQRFETLDFADGAPFRELARAIMKFGEIYERIESLKQQQMMELEKQRMEFTKDLEFQRMNMFMNSQLEVERMKRPKFGSSSAKKM